MLDALDALDTGALFSPCRHYRYMLWRRWDPERDVLMVIGLNPSTADETVDDQTIRKCRGYAQRWGYGALWMLNAYAFRATDPKVMKAQGANALGPRNNEYIAQCAQVADMVVAAWGAHCEQRREREIRALVARSHKPLYHLGLTKAGHPKHPLYLPGALEPQAWAVSPLDR